MDERAYKTDVAFYQVNKFENAPDQNKKEPLTAMKVGNRSQVDEEDPSAFSHPDHDLLQDNYFPNLSQRDENEADEEEEKGIEGGPYQNDEQEQEEEEE